MKIEVRKPDKEELEKLNIKSWPIWEKEPSKFDWYYDEKETCYILEGEVKVITDEGEVEFGAGDLVIFPAGLSCVWEISKKVRKHYNFG